MCLAIFANSLIKQFRRDARNYAFWTSKHHLIRLHAGGNRFEPIKIAEMLLDTSHLHYLSFICCSLTTLRCQLLFNRNVARMRPAVIFAIHHRHHHHHRHHQPQLLLKLPTRTFHHQHQHVRNQTNAMNVIRSVFPKTNAAVAQFHDPAQHAQLR